MNKKALSITLLALSLACVCGCTRAPGEEATTTMTTEIAITTAQPTTAEIKTTKEAVSTTTSPLATISTTVIEPTEDENTYPRYYDAFSEIINYPPERSGYLLHRNTSCPELEMAAEIAINYLDSFHDPSDPKYQNSNDNPFGYSNINKLYDDYGVDNLDYEEFLRISKPCGLYEYIKSYTFSYDGEYSDHDYYYDNYEITEDIYNNWLGKFPWLYSFQKIDIDNCGVEEIILSYYPMGGSIFCETVIYKWDAVSMNYEFHGAFRNNSPYVPVNINGVNFLIGMGMIQTVVDTMENRNIPNFKVTDMYVRYFNILHIKNGEAWIIRVAPNPDLD